MTQEKLKGILDAHKKWVTNEPDGIHADLSSADLRSADLRYADLSSADLSGADLHGADLSGADLRDADLRSADLRSADLRYADLSGADLSGADLRGADLSYADLRDADLSGADLSGADLSGADLRSANLHGADLSGADLSGATGLLSAINFLDAHFERTEKGYIAYKTFGSIHTPPDRWEIKSNSIIEEVVNPERQDDCGCGINVAPFQWVKDNYKGEVWKCLIEWPWLVGVIVPFSTDGKIRCERVRLLEVVKR